MSIRMPAGLTRLFTRRPDRNTGLGRGSYSTASGDLHRQAQQAGERDGRAHRPGLADVSLALHEQQIVHLFSQVVTNAAADVQRVDAQLLPEFLEARRDFQTAQRAYEAKRAESGIEGRPVLVEVGLGLYLFAVAALTLAEVAVNFAVFRALFPDSDLSSAIFAGTLGMAFLLGAHLIGWSLRQRRHLAWAYGIAVLCGAAVVGLAYGRSTLIAAENRSATVFGGVELNNLAVASFFLVCNLLFLVLAAWLAAKRHDPDETYDKCYRLYLRARRRAMALKGQRDENQRSRLAEAVDHVGTFRCLLIEYREANMNHRELKATPRAWLDRPVEALIALDEAGFAFDLPNDIGLRFDDAEAVVPPASAHAVP